LSPGHWPHRLVPLQRAFRDEVGRFLNVSHRPLFSPSECSWCRPRNGDGSALCNDKRVSFESVEVS
jgi:hypothetical protein